MRIGPIAGQRCEILGAGTGTGTTVTAGNTVKGSYATIGTTTFSYSSIHVAATMITRRQRFDIAYNTGGSDVILVEDIFGGDAAILSGNGKISIGIHLPVRIPTGATVKARSLGSSSSGTADVLISGYAGDDNRFAGTPKIVSCTDWTTADPPAVTTTGQTFTAWTTFMATTLYRIGKLWVVPSNNADATRTAGIQIVEVGWGAAAAERSLGAFIVNNATTVVMGIYTEIPCDIPAGSRLAFRVQHSNAGSADTFGLAGLGLVV